MCFNVQKNEITFKPIMSVFLPTTTHGNAFTSSQNSGDEERDMTLHL